MANNLSSIIMETVKVAHGVWFDDIIRKDVKEIINVHEADFQINI